jgi:predicted aldo/keto reductase-like oxidoreductase
MKRRDFIRKAAIGAVAAYAGPQLSGFAKEGGQPPLMQRELGKTGRKLSIIGFGGIVVSGVPQEEANESVRHAIERGVNYFDVAPSYGDAEERLGPALEPYRDKVFLACKTNQRTKDEAAKELQASLEKLRTDYLDLYQLHALTTMEELETCFAPGGAMEVFLEAREKGRIKLIGFSAHSVEVALEAMERFAFDSILFPLNYVLYSQGNFGPQVVKKAQEKGVGRLALKAMAKTHWPEGAERNYKKCWYQPISNPQEAEPALRFTLSEPITAAIPPGEPALFRMALDLASRFRPFTPEEREKLLQRAEGLTPIFRHPA